MVLHCKLVLHNNGCIVQTQKFLSSLNGILDTIEDADSIHLMTSPVTAADNVTS